jgi:hypothetical protein
MNMPVKADAEALKQTGGGGGGNRRKSILYSPLPLGQHASTKEKNKLYFGLFSPARWSLFNQDNHPVLQMGAVPSDLWSFYFKLEGHYIDGTDPNGKTRTQFVLCPSKMNTYLSDVLKYRPLFKDGRCRYCEENAAWWAKFEQEWGRSKLNGSPLNADRWSYDKEVYKQIIAQNPNLNSIKEEAGKYQAGPRWAFQVWDMSKLLEERPYDEGETSVDYQFYIGPKTVFEGLNGLYENGVPFYDSENPLLVILTKDCTDGGPRQAKYSVQNIGPLGVNAEELKYLQSDDSLPDLPWGAAFEEEAVVVVQSYNDMVEFGRFGGPPQSSYHAPVTQTANHPHSSGNFSTTQPEAGPAPIGHPTQTTTAPAPQSDQTPQQQGGAQPVAKRRGQNSW